MSGLKIVYQDPAKLKPRARNPRTHSPKQIKQIASSIEQFGFVSPVLVDARNEIIAGHGRVNAAKSMKMADVPTVRIDHLTPAQIRAYVIADNRLAENAGWDRSLLALELQELSVELNFDVAVTGFEVAEIDLLIGELGGAQPDKDDLVPAIDRSRPPISAKGDLWRIGNHMLLCGDALETASYQALLSDNKAQMVFTDPPYNARVSGHISGKGKIQHSEFAMASGEMSQDEFTTFLKTVFGQLTAHSSNGSIHFVCMDWRHMRETLDAAGPYSELKNLCVWSKTNAGMGSLYRSQHELVFVFKNGKAAHINNVELGRFGRNRTNIWTYAGANIVGAERDADLAMHPTVKPIALVTDAIMDCSQRGGIIVDSFAGSGTTLLAAERTGRRGYGIELDPYYVDTIIRRFSDVHDVEAIHVRSGKSFGTICKEQSARRSQSDGQKAFSKSSNHRSKTKKAKSQAKTKSTPKAKKSRR